jgi:AcrR family transcriptional regulator
MTSARLSGPALFAHPIAPAVMAVIRERGYERASVEQFLERAGIDRAAFDRQFAGKADATLRIFEAVSEDFQARVGGAFASAPRWPDSLRAAAWEMARWIRDNPEAIWFGMVGVLEAGEMALVRRDELFEWCAELVDAGRHLAPNPDAVARSAPLLAVGAIVEMLRREQERSFAGAIGAMVPQLMYAAVRPYLGEAAAQAELAIAPPPDLIEAER